MQPMYVMYATLVSILSVMFVLAACERQYVDSKTVSIEPDTKTYDGRPAYYSDNPVLNSDKLGGFIFVVDKTTKCEYVLLGHLVPRAKRDGVHLGCKRN